MRRALFLILFVSLFLILMQKVYEPDTYWHLKTGEIILKTKAIPDKEIFSFTTEGKDWTPPEWLADIIFYLIYKTGGFDLLNLFSILIYTSSFLLLFYILIQRGTSEIVSAALVTIAALGASERSQPRPHIFTYLFLALMIFLLDGYRLKDKKYLYILPVLGIFWVNLHPESLLAGIFFFSIIFMELLKIYLNKNIPEQYSYLRIENELNYEKIKYLIIISVLFFAVNILNPQGYKIFTFLFKHHDVIKKIAINEFLPIKFDEFPKTYLSIIILILLSFLGIIRNFQELPFVIGLGLLTIKLRRFLPEFYIFALPAAGVAIQFYLEHASRFIKKHLPSFPFRFLIGVSFLLFLLFVGYSIKTLYYYDIYDFKGIGIHRIYNPKNAFDFIEKNRIKPRVYNTANLGGAFILRFFPEQKVFEDTRLISYEALAKYKESPTRPDFFELARFFDINYAVIGTDLSILKSVPELKERWALVYFDDYVEIFVKRSPENEHIYKGKDFVAINPETIVEMVEDAVENSILPINVIYELRRAATLAPDSYKIHYALGSLLSLNNNDKAAIAEAKVELKKSIDILPLFPYSNKRLAEILSAEGNYNEAIYYYKRFLRSAELNKSDTLSDLLVELGILYMKAKNYSKAKQTFKRALKLDNKNTAARENLLSLSSF